MGFALIRVYGQMALVQGLGVVSLLGAAILMTILQAGSHASNYFTYIVPRVDVPFWHLSVLMFLVVNAIFIFRLATIEGGLTTPSASPLGSYRLSVPFNGPRIVAVVLMQIPLHLVLFQVIRAMSR